MPDVVSRSSGLRLVPPAGHPHLSQRLSARDAMSALNLHGDQSHDITRMFQETRKQLLGIEITKIKAAVAQTTVGDLVEHATIVFDDVAGRLVDRKALPRAGEHQAYYNEFSTLMLQLAARDLAQIQTTATANIMRELERPTYVEYQEPSFLDRLLGRK